MKRFSYYSLSRANKVLIHAFHLFQRKKNKLSIEEQSQFETQLRALQEAISQKKRKEARGHAETVQALIDRLFPKSSFEKSARFIIALSIALCFALLIRQTLFELYEIPTGSMRDTLQEKDRLLVSKTTFGINMPFRLKQIYFDPDLVQRSGIVVFSGQDMDIRDVDTKYFYLFPGKKQYVKRMIGKPGDTLYFYGGLIYGIDKHGNDISKELQLPSLSTIDHIPFIRFDGKVETPSSPVHGVYNTAIIYQMNEPIATLVASSSGQVEGKTLASTTSFGKATPSPPLYSDFWGIKNYGMGRLLTKEQVRRHTHENPQNLPSTDLYLEISHNPNFQNSKMGRDLEGRTRPMLGLNSSVLPLNTEHLQTLFNHLYTARFVVKDGFAHRYGSAPQSAQQSQFLPQFSNVPDGTYQFYHGIAYKVGTGGIISPLPKDHSLYTFTTRRVQSLYNLGIEMDTRFSPSMHLIPIFPSRYVYFRDGSLYTMGAPIVTLEDPILKQFKQQELNKQEATANTSQYKAFIDYGPPLKQDGTLDVNFVKQFGIMIPEKSYLVLGDNHAMSGDSREFGFVPQENLKGAPDFIFWPPGSRFGRPNQPSYPFMNFPRGIMWAVTLTGLGIYYLYQRKRNQIPKI